MVFVDVCWYTLMSWILTQAHLLGTKTWTGKQAPHHFPRKQKNQPFMIFMPLTVAVTGHPISVTKNPTSSQLGMFCLTTLFYFSKPPKGCSEHQTKNMTNRYESPSPGIRWSHSPFLRTSISQCLGGHVPGRDEACFMVDSGDGEPRGFGEVSS